MPPHLWSGWNASGGSVWEARRMGIELKQTDDASLLQLKGAVDVSSAAELKGVLLEAAAREKPIRVSAEALTELDVTGYQLLWAARRRAQQRGVDFAFATPMPQAVEDALQEMGLDELAPTQ